MPSKLSHRLLPVLSLLLSATLWGVIWYPLRLLEQGGLAGLWATLIIYTTASLLGLVLALPYLGQLGRRPWLMLLLAAAAGWCNVSFILAMLEGTVMRVLLLFYLSPVWATLLGCAHTERHDIHHRLVVHDIGGRHVAGERLIGRQHHQRARRHSKAALQRRARADVHSHLNLLNEPRFWTSTLHCHG